MASCYCVQLKPRCGAFIPSLSEPFHIQSISSLLVANRETVRLKRQMKRMEETGKRAQATEGRWPLLAAKARPLIFRVSLVQPWLSFSHRAPHLHWYLWFVSHLHLDLQWEQPVAAAAPVLCTEENNPSLGLVHHPNGNWQGLWAHLWLCSVLPLAVLSFSREIQMWILIISIFLSSVRFHWVKYVAERNDCPVVLRCRRTSEWESRGRGALKPDQSAIVMGCDETKALPFDRNSADKLFKH